VSGWTFTVGAKSVEGWISGPKHQLDINIHSAGDAAARSLPHGIVGKVVQSEASCRLFLEPSRVGIVGQSFSAPTPRNGKRDVYPGSYAGRFKTSAMAEGAIEGAKRTTRHGGSLTAAERHPPVVTGSAAMYEVASPYETRFAFSRFDEEEAANPSHELLGTGGDASITEAAEEE